MAEMIKFILNGCDISIVAEAPTDMTLEQFVKQADRVRPPYCACGVCYADEWDNPEVRFTYDDVIDLTMSDNGCSGSGITIEKKNKIRF